MNQQYPEPLLPYIEQKVESLLEGLPIYLLFFLRYHFNPPAVALRYLNTLHYFISYPINRNEAKPYGTINIQETRV